MPVAFVAVVVAVGRLLVAAGHSAVPDGWQAKLQLVDWQPMRQQCLVDGQAKILSCFKKGNTGTRITNSWVLYRCCQWHIRC